MGEVTYANFLSEAQANLWALLRADATVALYTKNIVDGIPLGLTKNTGFPYVIVPTPEINDEEYITFTRKKESITFNIEVYDRKEAILRKLCDAIRNCAETNKQLFHNDYGMFKFMNSSGNLSYAVQEDGAVVYNYRMAFSYEWVAW